MKRSLLFVAILVASAALAHDSIGNVFRQVTVRDAESRLALANDGTPQIFYYRPGTNDKLWMLYLEGGGWCSAEVMCNLRYQNAKYLMSSAARNATVEGGGFYSNLTTNPFREANIIFMPYLTSDSYIGNVSTTESGLKFQFRGRPCLQAVVEDIFNGFTFDGATVKAPLGSQFMLIGSSAGGQGVLLNANYIGQLVREIGVVTQFAVVPDCGYFIGNVQYLRNASMCPYNFWECPYGDGMQMGFSLWGSEAFIEPACGAFMRKVKLPLYNCALGNIAIYYVHEKLFLMSYLFDYAELLIDGCPQLACMNTTKGQNFVEELTKWRREAFKPLPSFLPSCVGHQMAFTDSYLGDMKIGDVTLARALKDFFFLGKTTSYQDKCATPMCRKCPQWP